MSLDQGSLKERTGAKKSSRTRKSPKPNFKAMQVREKLVELEDHGDDWEFKRQVREAIKQIEQGEYIDASMSLEAIAGGIEEGFFKYSYDFDGMEKDFEKWANTLSTLQKMPRLYKRVPKGYETARYHGSQEQLFVRFQKQLKTKDVIMVQDKYGNISLFIKKGKKLQK